MLKVGRRGRVGWMSLLLGAGLLCGGPRASAQPEDAIRIQDDRGDDYGAGKVRYPEDALFLPGSLDATEFRAIPFSGGVQFEIDFAVRIPRPPDDRKISQRTYLRELQNNGLFLQNVDIYIDRDGVAGSGETLTLPGRNADIEPSSAWERAVVITPQPHAARAILKMADRELADKVLFPDTLQLRGKTLIVEVPDSFLGTFDRQWGYVVAVTGASFDESFRMLDPNISGFGRSIFARIVRPSRDAEYFGGGDQDGLNSNIIDLVLPPGMDQKKMLTPDHEAGKWAVLQAVFPNGRPPLRASAASPPPGTTPVPGVTPAAAAEGQTLTGTVIDFDTGTVVIDIGKARGNRKGRLGRVLDEQGQTLVRFVVSELLADFAVGKILEGDASKLRQGLRVELKSGGEG
jgi:glucodextranase-like protein